MVYELLYDRVFGAGKQVSVARRLLRKSDTIYPKEFMKDGGREYDSDIEYDHDEDSLIDNSHSLLCEGRDATSSNEQQTSEDEEPDDMNSNNEDTESRIQKDDNNNTVGHSLSKDEEKKKTSLKNADSFQNMVRS